MRQYQGQGFAISYPADWTPHPEGKLGKNARFELVDMAEDNEEWNVALDVWIFRNESPEVWLDYFSDNAATTERFDFLGKSKVDVRGGGVGYITRMRYAPDGEGVEIQTDLLTETVSGDTLDVRLNCQKEECARYQDIYETIFDSVRITG